MIRDELVALRDEYGDERRTEIVSDQEDLTMEDLITEEDVVVTLSHAGYAKSQPVSRLSRPAPRRPRQGRHHGEGRGFHRQPVRGQYP